MSISTTYLLNVALHAAALSIFSSLVVLAMRQARHRSVAIILALLAVGLLPWLTALRPAQPAAGPVAESQPSPSVLPTWTISVTPAMAEHREIAEPDGAPEKWILPDPLESLITIWAAGSGIGFIMLGIAMLKVRIWRKFHSLPDETVWQRLRSLATEVPARDRFRISESTASPCVTGFWKPEIVIPRFLLDGDSEEGLRWAVRHEIAHWQAGDSRWMMLFALIRAVNWWNPLVHQLVAKWSDAREQLCDLRATCSSEDRAGYGKFLVSMAGRITRQPSLAVAMAKRPHAVRLKRRIVSLLGAGNGSESPVGGRFIGAGSAAFVGCAVLVSMLRIGAEEPEKSDPGVIAAENESVERQAKEELPASPATAPPTPEVPLPTPVGKATPVAAVGKAVSQVKISTKFIMTVTRSTTKDGAVLTKPELDFLMRTLALTKGTDLMTAPSVAARIGQEATIEIIREVPGTPEQIAARGPKSPTPFTGIRVKTSVDLIDGQANLKFEPDYRTLPGLSLTDYNKTPPPKTDPDKIKVVKRAVTSRLSAGQTLHTDLGETDPGKFLQALTTVEPLDSNGRILDSFKNGKVVETSSDSSKVPDLHEGRLPQAELMERVDASMRYTAGLLQLDAVVIDLPRDPKLPELERNFLKLHLATDDSLDALVKHYQLKKRKLKQVRMPLNERRTPWPEFPGIRLSATTSLDLMRIALSNDSEENGTSLFSPFSSGGMVLIDVASDDPSIERRVYITAKALPR